MRFGVPSTAPLYRHTAPCSHGDLETPIMKATGLGNFTSRDHQVCYPRWTRDFSLDRKASFGVLNTTERHHAQGVPSSFLAAFSLLTWNLPHFLAVAVAILAGACQSHSQPAESRRPRKTPSLRSAVQALLGLGRLRDENRDAERLSAFLQWWSSCESSA